MAKKKTEPKKKAKKAKKPARKPAKKKAGKTLAVTKRKTPARKKAPSRAGASKASPKPKTAEKSAEPDLPWRRPLPGESFVGVVDDFYSHVSVIALKLQSPLKVGERIHVRGHTTDMSEIVDSLQIEHAPVPEAQAGDSVGIKTVGKCRAGDYVYKGG